MTRSRKRKDAENEAVDYSQMWSALGLADRATGLSEHADGQVATSSWWHSGIRGIAGTLLVLLPVFGYLAYDLATKAHRPVTIAIGPLGGRHESIETSIGTRIAKEKVRLKEPVPSTGSLENVRRMQIGDIDFALYQSGTEHLLGESEFDDLDANEDDLLSEEECPDYWQGQFERVLKKQDTDDDNALSRSEFRSLSNVRFVANLFSEVVHVIVRKDARITDETDFANKVIAAGAEASGNYAMSRLVVKHFGVSDTAQLALTSSYEEIVQGLITDDPELRVDAAILTSGLGAKHIRRIMASGACALFPIDRAESLCMKNVFVSPTEIPIGVYHGPQQSLHLPSKPLPTIGVQAQLVVREDVGVHLVGQVASSVLSDKFLKSNQLYELYQLEPARRRAAARSKPDFEIHPGAGSFYDPHEFDAGQFEGWESLYSLIASAVIASYFLGRWLIRRRNRLRGHQLDVYLNRLLRIEMRQAGLDANPDRDDSRQLQILLNEITGLRQQALGEFSAHQLNEDPAQYCFLEMCHYISEKINAKLLRQRLDRRFRELSHSIQPLDPHDQELRSEEVE